MASTTTPSGNNNSPSGSSNANIERIFAFLVIAILATLATVAIVTRDLTLVFVIGTAGGGSSSPP
ncbi:hypothetical protein ACU686_13045 [Yinghuangia aomiensis]